MSYRIGDTLLPGPAGIYRDPEGKQPRSISEAPVSMIHQVNVPCVDLVTARASYIGVSPAAKQNLTWAFYRSGLYTDGIDELPHDRQWLIFQVSTEASAGGVDWGIKPALNEQGASFGVGAWWDCQTLGTATEPRGLSATSSQPFPQLWLPYGGQVQVLGDGVATLTGYWLAAGFHRGASVLPF